VNFAAIITWNKLSVYNQVLASLFNHAASFSVNLTPRIIKRISSRNFEARKLSPSDENKKSQTIAFSKAPNDSIVV
jgi:hypothetical protein